MKARPLNILEISQPQCVRNYPNFINLLFNANVHVGVGSSAIIYQPPSVSMRMGSSQVNVGSAMTGDVLFTSVSNAIKSLCPTPTSGGMASCQTTPVNVGEATWLKDKAPEEGQLTLRLDDSQYNSSTLDLFINIIAGAANASATGSNCNLLDWLYTTEGTKRDLHGRVIGGPAPEEHRGSGTFCNINGFFDTELSIHGAVSMFMDVDVSSEKLPIVQ